MRLTDKGERWVLHAYRTVITVLVLGSMLIVAGMVGWIEGAA